MRIGALASGIRSFTQSLFSKNTQPNWLVARSNRDFKFDVGDGTSSSTVMAPLMWVARTFPEAPVGLWTTRQQDNQEEQVKDHPLLRLLRRPNQHYSGTILWMATLVDYFADGNGYWLKLRDRAGQVQELWWAPSWMMKPCGNETDFISHYEYKPNTETINIPKDDVVHFRFGLDSDNPRVGRAPLKSVLREVFTDDEAATFTASLLRNMGVPGLLVSPDGDAPPSPSDVEDVKAYLRTAFTGDKRGEALVMSGPTKIQQFGFSPEQMLLKELRRIPEERVTAVLGVPAIVAGLGAGLDRSTFTNFAEAREAAYEQTIIPTQTTMSEDIWFQLLPDFERADVIWSWRVGFDLSNVRVLQPDQTALVQRLDVGIRGGWIRRAEGRRALNLPVGDIDEVYLVQSATVEVPADGGPARNFATQTGPVTNVINGKSEQPPLQIGDPTP